MAIRVISNVSGRHYRFRLEIGSILKPNGQVLIVEPPFHVSKHAFEKIIIKARNAGFTLVGRPKVLFSKTAVLKKGEQNA